MAADRTIPIILVNLLGINNILEYPQELLLSALYLSFIDFDLGLFLINLGFEFVQLLKIM